MGLAGPARCLAEGDYSGHVAIRVHACSVSPLGRPKLPSAKSSSFSLESVLYFIAYFDSGLSDAFDAMVNFLIFNFPALHY